MTTLPDLHKTGLQAIKVRSILINSIMPPMRRLDESPMPDLKTIIKQIEQGVALARAEMKGD